jgi:hypothetical protein
MSQTTDELVLQVREQLDEFNEDTLDDSQAIRALNRSQTRATNITSRRSAGLIAKFVDITTADDAETYDMPTDTFAQKITDVQVIRDSLAWPLTKVAIGTETPYLNSAQVEYPFYYLAYNNVIKPIPKPNNGVTLRFWYLQKPDSLVEQQGRITAIDTSNNYIQVDSLGSSLSTSTSTIASGGYISVINYTTGAVKESYQISSLNTTSNRINIKTSGLTRSSVLGKTISTSIGTTPAQDDYVCLINGTCVSQLPDAYINFVIQNTVVEVKRRFGEPSNDEIVALRDAERELKKAWAGRENAARVRKTNSKLNSYIGPVRRYLG